MSAMSKTEIQKTGKIIDFKILTNKVYADILKAAGHPIRLKVIFLLYQHKEGLNFKQIEDQIGVRANALDFHLNTLTDEMIVIQKIRKTQEKGVRSFYILTEIGKTIIERGIIGLLDQEKIAEKFSP